MRGKELLFVAAFVVVIVVAMAASKLYNSTETAGTDGKATDAPLVITQLNEEGRESSATMVLVGAPPMQPADHIDRWNPELRTDSCMSCHAQPDSTGAKAVPADHFINNEAGGKIFRDNCIQCHGQQNDTKTAFNEE